MNRDSSAPTGATPTGSHAPLLWPPPQSLHLHGGTVQLPANGVIVLSAGDETPRLAMAARAVQAGLRAHAGVDWPLIAGAFGVGDAEYVLSLSVVPGATSHAQGAVLQVTAQRADLVASTAAGLFHAMQTLRQLARACGGVWPLLSLRDEPDLPNRGFMLDISRDRVPTFERLLQWVDLLASLKVNQLQLYTEHTFAYRNHPEVWAKASPLTGDEILALDAYCRERFIELVPNQNTFGHMRRWLVLDRYRDLAEAPDGCDTRWGRFTQPFSLNPGDPRSLDLVSGLLDELLPHFSSRQVNVGLDETVDLGEGRSRAAVQERGIGPVFLEYLLKVVGEVKRRGRTAQVWGDIIMEHPELVGQLPRDLIALEWGYEADHRFDDHAARYAASGVPFYLCPGTSSWNSVVGRTDNALENVRNAARNCKKHGAVGLLMTDWGDNGHWQPPTVSLLPLAFGAAAAWNVDATCAPGAEETLVAAADLHLLQDEARVLAAAALALGRLHALLPLQTFNSGVLFHFLQLIEGDAHGPAGTMGQGILQRASSDAWRAGFVAVLQEVDRLQSMLDVAHPQAQVAADMVPELRWAAAMMRHAATRGLWLLDGRPAAQAEALHTDARTLLETYTALWMRNSRPGGFEESVALLRALCDSYTA